MELWIKQSKMKSSIHAPIIAMALLLALLMWLCSSCEKKPVYTGKGKIDDLMRKLDSTSNVGYLDTALPGWRIKGIIMTSDIKDGTVTSPKPHWELIRELDSLKAELENCKIKIK